MRRRVLVLHSGGMDSTVCLYAAHREGHEVISLGVDYGQRLAVEMTFAEQQAAAIGARREVVRVQWEKPQRQIPLDRDVEEMPSSVSPAFLPGRNIVFLSLAAAHAAGLYADEIHIGLNCVDFSGYPDCTEEFFESFKNMFAIASPGGASLQAPLMRMSKRQIALQARELGLGEWDTWSCYRPQRVNGTIAPCHHCDACKLHAHAWAGL
jgi:7-cyano-7-deazaguanine synthase